MPVFQLGETVQRLVQCDRAEGLPAPPRPLVEKPRKPEDAYAEAGKKGGEALLEVLKKNPHVQAKLEELKAGLRSQLRKNPALVVTIGAVLLGGALTIAETKAQGSEVPDLPAIPLDGLGKGWAGWSVAPQYKAKFGQLGRPEQVGLTFTYQPPEPAGKGKAAAGLPTPVKTGYDESAVRAVAGRVNPEPFEWAGPEEERKHKPVDLEELAVQVAEEFLYPRAKGGDVTIALGEYPFGNPGALAASLQQLVSGVAQHCPHEGVKTVTFTYSRPGKGQQTVKASVPAGKAGGEA